METLLMIDEANKEVVIYAAVDQRQDYLNIIRGLQILISFYMQGDYGLVQTGEKIFREFTC